MLDTSSGCCGLHSDLCTRRWPEKPWLKAGRDAAVSKRDFVMSMSGFQCKFIMTCGINAFSSVSMDNAALCERAKGVVAGDAIGAAEDGRKTTVKKCKQMSPNRMSSRRKRGELIPQRSVRGSNIPAVVPAVIFLSGSPTGLPWNAGPLVM